MKDVMIQQTTPLLIDQERYRILVGSINERDLVKNTGQNFDSLDIDKMNDQQKADFYCLVESATLGSLAKLKKQLGL